MDAVDTSPLNQLSRNFWRPDMDRHNEHRWLMNVVGIFPTNLNKNHTRILHYNGAIHAHTFSILKLQSQAEANDSQTLANYQRRQP